MSYIKNDNHVYISIYRYCTVQAHVYGVNSQLSRLVNNGSLQSKLYLYYLYVLTSFCLPDTFINRTSIEQALSILNSAAIRLFGRLIRTLLEAKNYLSCRI